MNHISLYKACKCLVSSIFIDNMRSPVSVCIIPLDYEMQAAQSPDWCPVISGCEEQQWFLLLQGHLSNLDRIHKTQIRASTYFHMMKNWKILVFGRFSAQTWYLKIEREKTHQLPKPFDYITVFCVPSLIFSDPLESLQNKISTWTPRVGCFYHTENVIEKTHIKIKMW